MFQAKIAKIGVRAFDVAAPEGACFFAVENSFPALEDRRLDSAGKARSATPEWRPDLRQCGPPSLR